MSWTDTNLGTLIDFYDHQRKPLSSTVRADFQGEYRYYGAQGVIDYVKDYIFEGEYVLVAEDGENLRSRNQPVAFNVLGKFWVNNHAHIIKAKDGVSTNKFIQSLLNTIPIDAYVTGAAQPKLSQANLKAMKVRVPDYDSQQKIAAILSAYDDLIENNLQRIKLLEDMAQITYEEWFVRMKFPGHEYTPIDPETGLPEGWSKKKIHTIGQVITGKTPSTSNEDYYGGEILFIKTPDMADHPYVIKTEQHLSEEGAKSQYKKYLPKNSLIISCIGSAGVYALTAMPSQTNQQINAIKFNDEFYVYYMYCYSKHIKPLLEGLGSNGATMTNVNKSKFEAIEVTFPSESLLRKFENEASKNFKVILTLQNQNQLLKEARDILLPRLMTGMIDVETIELPEALLARMDSEASAA